MTFRLNLAADIADLNRGFSSLNRAIVDKAIPRALNKGIQKTRSVAVKEVAPQFKVTQRTIRRTMRIVRASKFTGRALVMFRSRGLNPVKLGLSAAQAEALYKGPKVGQAFLMTVANGSEQYMVRLPKSQSSSGKDSKGRPRKGRLPVRSIRVRVGEPGVRALEAALKTEGRAAFIKEYERNLGLIRRGLL